VADLLDRLDRDAEAAAKYQGAAEAFREAGDVHGELHNRRRAMLSQWWAGEQDAAFAAMKIADEVAAEAGATDDHLRWEQAMLGYDAGRILGNNGQPDIALSRVVPAVAAFRELNCPGEAATAETLRARLLVDLGRQAEAEAVLTAALGRLPEDADELRQRVEGFLNELREPKEEA
jgi:hypothetical protein